LGGWFKTEGPGECNNSKKQHLIRRSALGKRSAKEKRTPIKSGYLSTEERKIGEIFLTRKGPTTVGEGTCNKIR